ncbi:MAG TPA: sigma-54 dependent transcriptional regulator [Terriglobales bacterium]|jgi:DNA-binding NtrC family response regulator|nr:sigma-54 dependent transcriptional regulator [Terriglobales bacterium]
MTTFPIPPNYADHILVASPSPVVRQRVLESLRSPARRFEQASGGAEALGHLENGFWQVLFLDRHLPDLDAEELGQTVRRRFPKIEVVMLDPEPESGHGPDHGPNNEAVAPSPSLEHALVRPDSVIDNNELALLPTLVARSTLDAPLPGMIGSNSRMMQPVYRLVRLLAPRNTTVLITGPTGCGKELVARAIHQLSSRAPRAFAVVNCAAIPETLLEAELFGYARGSFTGAAQSYAGRIQAAQGGTLFLDEIGEMPLSLQPKLLRFLEQKELQRLGSAEVVRVDARVISATNAHLLSLVREGKFREDLYYRLCGFPIEIPPLRDRLDDIAALTAHFLEKYASPLPPPQMSFPALQLLKRQRWAGNIRELQNVIERALILSEEQNVIRPEHLMLTDSGFCDVP